MFTHSQFQLLQRILRFSLCFSYFLTLYHFFPITKFAIITNCYVWCFHTRAHIHVHMHKHIKSKCKLFYFTTQYLLYEIYITSYRYLYIIYYTTYGYVRTYTSKHYTRSVNGIFGPIRNWKRCAGNRNVGRFWWNGKNRGQNQYVSTTTWTKFT